MARLVFAMTDAAMLHRAKFASVVFDADSTLSAIEGIDWLGTLRGPDVAAEIEALTNRAMDGLVPLDAVYAERIARIRPTREELRELGEVYVQRVVPGVAELVAALHSAGVVTVIVSGGIRHALLPLARHLGVDASDVHAVSLASSAGDDVLDAIDGEQPLATQMGKVRVVESLVAAGGLPSPVVMVGDGATDAAVRGVVDAFLAFTGVMRREAVVAVAAGEARDMRELRGMLFE